uniref:pentatricopeptide repeat-containing protein At5g39680-like n=1 Tax=Erigeron canadensis TaxID=72917 RepID=UPI001CB8CDFB|nr:pentatricopeptide repeat-containing protein At5g39680-like [Erigeron canadensis]XP_043617327.1 pentatricopeptide repeat-containing protein At5g39680-like [Erigeron canadensis]
MILCSPAIIINQMYAPPLFLPETIKRLAGTKNLKLGKVIHAHLIVSKQPHHDNLLETNALINLYSKCSNLDYAHKLFDKMPQRTVVSWSALMSGFFQNGFDFNVLNLFKSMVSEEGMCQPNEYIFSSVLSSCSNIGDSWLGKQCHGYVLKTGLVFHQYVNNAVVRFYSVLSDVVGALEVLRSVPGSDTCTYNLILNGLIEIGNLNEVLGILRRMVDEGVAWNKATYISSMGLCARFKDLRLGREVHCQIVKSDVEFDVFVCSAIVDMYGKCRDVLSAGKVFHMSQDRNVVSWTAMLAAYSQHGCFEEVLKLFIDMQCEGFAPNDSTFCVLLKASGGLSTIGYGYSLHALVEKTGFKGHKNVGNALIDMYSRSGDIDAARKIFESMTNRDIVTWNTMINGYSHHGLGKKSLDLFQEMLKMDEDPNHVTFVGVLTACGHLGDVESGFYFLNQLMKEKGIEPSVEHYTSIVGLLCKAGQLNEAKIFMLSMPIKWDAVAWRTLLNACNVHRNYTLGIEIGNTIMDLDPKDVGTYTLLSNMHAKANKWGGVSKIRNLMRSRKIKKEPGLSWLEIKNQTHVFVSDDNKHPDFVEIQEKLKELFGKIKECGYVVDTSNVQYDIEEEQKEDSVGYHSEKLAVAYALLRTHEGAPIRILKNLRICDDCHSAMKLISKVTNRVITIRDAKRFHCFQDGSCSCVDYW